MNSIPSNGLIIHHFYPYPPLFSFSLCALWVFTPHTIVHFHWKAKPLSLSLHHPHRRLSTYQWCTEPVNVEGRGKSTSSSIFNCLGIRHSCASGIPQLTFLYLVISFSYSNPKFRGNEGEQQWGSLSIFFGCQKRIVTKTGPFFPLVCCMLPVSS